MKYVFFINSFSVKKETANVIEKIKILSDKLGLDYEIRTNSKDVSTEDVLSEYRDSNNIIVSLGGDGTLNRVVNCVYGTNNAISVMPLGTGNDFYNDVIKALMNNLKMDLIK